MRAGFRTFVRMPLRFSNVDVAMEIVLAIIIALLPVLVWALRIAWSPSAAEGELLLRIAIPLYSRIKMLAMPVGLSLAIAIAAYFFDALPGWGIGLVIAICIVLLAIPMSYTLTSIGIRVGLGQFRRWTEFAGVRRSAVGALLQGVEGKRSYPIFLGASPEDDEFVLTLKNLIRDSYKGKADTESALRSRRSGGR